MQKAEHGCVVQRAQIAEGLLRLRRVAARGDDPRPTRGHETVARQGHSGVDFARPAPMDKTAARISFQSRLRETILPSGPMTKYVGASATPKTFVIMFS